MTGQPWGATPEEWAHWDLVLGLTSDLLPVVSRPDAKISPDSKMQALGKTPSRYNPRHEVAGIPKWTELSATGPDVESWSRQPDYGICLQTRFIRALDIDVDDPEQAAAIAALIEPHGLPCRQRNNSSKRLYLFALAGDLPKRSFRTAHGLVELLGTGQQCVVAGTHPSGARIEWRGGLPLDIPEMSLGQVDELWAALVDQFAVAPPAAGVLRKRGEQIHGLADPVADWLIEQGLVLGEGRDGALYVGCPWSDEHSSASGITEAAWFPAGSNGYDKGNFRCLHAHCLGRGADEFMKAVGYVEAGFDVVEAADADAAPTAPAAVVLDPKDSMRQARAAVEHCFTDDGVVTLIRSGGLWLEHTGPCYAIRDEEDVRRRAWCFLDSAWKVEGKAKHRVRFAPTRDHVGGLVDALRAVVGRESIAAPCWLDGRDSSAFDYLSLTDGLLHIPTRSMQPHEAAFFTLNSLPFAWGKEAERPVEWLAFLESVWPGDVSSQNTLQEMFGYLLTPDTSQQKMFMLIGPRRSGKGTIGRVLTAIVGADNVASPTLSSLTGNFGLQPLIGKLVATIPDARIGGSNAQTQAVVEKLLMLSGEDSLTIDRKNTTAWNGRPSVRIVISTNEVPKLGDASGALASRFIVLSMAESFYGREDRGLEQRLLKELPGILRWSLDGRERLLARGHFVQPVSGQEDLDDLFALGSPPRVFFDECCERDSNGQEVVANIFAVWRNWCGQNGQYVGSTNGFSRKLKEAVPGLSHCRVRPAGGEPTNGLRGLRLKSRYRDAFCENLPVPVNDVTDVTDVIDSKSDRYARGDGEGDRGGHLTLIKG